nr:BRO family protein [Natroniella acetigena]
MQVFENKNSGQVSTMNNGDEIWFVAKDVCDVLDLSNPSTVVNRLDDGV